MPLCYTYVFRKDKLDTMFGEPYQVLITDEKEMLSN